MPTSSIGTALINSQTPGVRNDSDMPSNQAGLAPLSLTVEQQAVVNHQQGHARIIAVAGAGKTTTLVHFVVQRCLQGTPARRMLVLMYNKAAQQHFQNKLSEAMPDHSTGIPSVRTFHSLGWRIYQGLIERGFLPPVDNRPISEREMEGRIWQMLQQLADAETRKEILAERQKWVEPAVNFIERVKASLESPEIVFEQLGLPPQCRLFIELFSNFEEWRKQQGRITFSDMIYDPLQCFRQFPAAANVYSGHMDWIVVDEYQDINAAQHELLKILHGHRGSLVVIGDPDQTIYEFRGSKPEFIVDTFSQEFQPVTDYQLSTTFRYGHQLALCANQLIRHNQQRRPVVTISGPDTPATQVSCYYTAKTNQKIIQYCQQSQRPLHEIAVLYRLWSQSAELELLLLAHQIPYQLDAAQSVLNRRDLQLFWLLLEIGSGLFSEKTPPQRLAAWQLLLTTPFPKIKRDTLMAMAQQLQLATTDLASALQAAIPDSLSKWQQQQLQQRAQLISELELSKASSFTLLNNYALVTELEEGLQDTAFSTQQATESWQVIKAFLTFIKSLNKNCADTYQYLKQLQQRANNDSQTAGQHPEFREDSGQPSAGIFLTSIHKSKGREWPEVIVPDIDERFYPYQPEREWGEPFNIESERRLLYVALTRCQQHLHCYLPESSAAPNKAMGNVKRPSKIPANLSTTELSNSPFVEEAQLTTCIGLGQALNKQPVEDTIKLPLVSQQHLALFMHYLEKIGVDSRLTVTAPINKSARKNKPSSKSTSSADQSTIKNSGKVIDKRHHWPRISHSTLGHGVIVSDDESHIKIQFDNEPGLRVFRRSIVEPLLTYLND